MKTKRFKASAIISVWATTLLLSLVAPLIQPSGQQKVSAAPTSWKWLNAQTLQDNEGHNYLDVKIGDNTHLYAKQVTSLNCPNQLEINGNDVKSVDHIDIRGWETLKTQPSSGHDYWTAVPGNTTDTRCRISMTSGNITIANPENSVLTYSWIDKDTIRHFEAHVSGDRDNGFTNRLDDATYKRLASGEYQEQGSNSDLCRNIIRPSSDGRTAVLVYSTTNGSGNGCTTTNYNIRLALIDNFTKDPGSGGGNNGGGNNNGGNAKPPESCETKSANSVLGWLICGFINIIDGTINFLDTEIQKLLIVDMKYFTDPKFVQTWGVIRNISLLILVPIMLIMVISTALDIGPFDAYTVRKAMPRFLVAVGFIVGSLPIYKFFVQLSNVVETGILGLITSAFGQDAQRITLQSLFNPSGGDTALIFSGLVVGVVGAISTGALTLGVAFSFALVTVTGLSIGYVVLQIRVVLIVGLGLVSSLAILAWIFAGNDKLWKLWRGTAFTMLMLGPLLGLFVGVSRVLASLATEWWLKIFFYVIVYFLITAIIQAFGGVLGTVMNGFNQRTQGFFRGQAKMRENSREKAWGKFRAGERGPGFVKKAGFTTGAFLEAEKKGRFLTSGRYRREAVAQQHKLNELRYAQTERAKATQDDDGYMLQALTYGSAAEARARMGNDWGASATEIERSVAAANATGGFSAARQNYATRRLAATGTGYQNIEQMQRTVARVAGSNRSMAADLLGEMNAVTKNAGRHDLAAGFGNQLDMYEQIQARGGYQAVANGGSGATALTQDEYRRAHVAAAKDIDAVTFMRDKNKAVENMSQALAESFRIAEASGDRAEAARIAGLIAKVEQSGTYASLTNVETAGTTVIEPTSGTTTVRATGPNGVPINVPVDGRQAIQASGRVMSTVNPVTKKLETVRALDSAGNPIIDPRTGRPVPALNPRRDEPTAEIYRRHGPQRPTDPNSPDY